MCLVFVTGLSLVLVGYLVPVVQCRIAGIFLLIFSLVIVIMRGVVHFSSAEQRAASLPYTGFNTRYLTDRNTPKCPLKSFHFRAPGVSWGKVFARQREGSA